MIIGEVIGLVSYGSFGGGAIGNLLSQWQAVGIFDYALPFLLIFALVFAILGFVPIFKGNKGINVTISLVTALMALQFGLVSNFFPEIFSRLGIGLAIVLVVIILVGLLIQDKEKGNKFMRWVVAIAMVAVAIWVISSSLNNSGFSFGSGQLVYFLRANLAAIVGIGLFVGLIIAIVVKPKANNNKSFPINISGLGANAN